jgi:hypothetical protein
MGCACGMLSADVAASGCVVASTPTFKEPDDCPPYFVPDEASPSLRTIPVISAGNTEFKAQVPMKSCAVATAFEGRIFVDNALVSPVSVDATGNETRTVSFDLPMAAYAPGCHSVELLATSAFSPVDFRTPRKPGDLASILWWVAVVQDGTDVSLLSCNK